MINITFNRYDKEVLEIVDIKKMGGSNT